MADVGSSIKNKQPSKTEQNHTNPSKYFNRFVLKALLVAMFLVLFQLLPTQHPEFIDQSLVNRSWELLHLLFVGIAVSYGLFSSRNEGADKENGETHSRFENAQSYMSRLLQVSSVFDDESDSSGPDDGKVQTWSHQYFRSENPIVSEKEHSVIDEQTASSSEIRDEKPLLLPVRSLKSHASEKNLAGSKMFPVHPASVDVTRSRSSSSSKRFSSKAPVDGFGGVHQGNSEVGMDENVVLRSPIPWRSRSGKMEVRGVKDEIDSYPSPFNLTAPMEDSELSRPEAKSFKSRTSRPSRPNSAASSPSPKKLSPSPSLSSEPQAKGIEDSVRKKSIYASSTPPPPPPPPPQVVQRLSTWNPRPSHEEGDDVSFERSMRPRSSGNEEKDLYKENVGVGVKQRGNFDGSLMGKSVRTIRPSSSLRETKRDWEAYDRKNATFRTEQLTSHEDAATYLSKKATFLEEKQRFLEKVTVETEESESESETEEDDEEEGEQGKVRSPSPSPSHGNSPSSVIDGASDVDKKADEFIAKIREQIRLQRIDSIKRSSGSQMRKSISR